MSLEDIYSNNVSKNSVNIGPGGMPVSRERDPNQIKLENDVFSRINNITKQENPNPLPEIRPNQVSTIDFEQALRELSDSSQSFDDKS